MSANPEGLQDVLELDTPTKSALRISMIGDIGVRTANSLKENVDRWRQTVSRFDLWILVAASGSLIAGVVQAIFLKWMNREKVENCITPDNCVPEHFNQAFLQTFFMFFGEILSLPLFFFFSRKNYRFVRNRSGQVLVQPVQLNEEEVGEPSTPSTTVDIDLAEGETPEKKVITAKDILWWMSPMPFDFLECAFTCVAITITFTSTVQMLHNFVVICSAVFTLLIIRIPLKVHEWVGCLTITAALVLSGIPAIVYPEQATNYNSSLHWLGIISALVGTAFQAMQNVWEEFLFKKSNVPASLAVGIEGASGTVLAGLVLPLVWMSGYENPLEGLRNMRENSVIMAGMLGYAFTSFLNNFLGCTVTAGSTALLRVVFMSLKPPLVWAVEIYYGWNFFDWYNLMGMVVLTVGLLVYLMVPPFDKLGEGACGYSIRFGSTTWWREYPPTAK